MLALYTVGMANNIYAQVGLVLLIGLSTKTAILIVEFAMEQRAAGETIFNAALNAAKMRFRAVLMTAFSFILGVLPLVFAIGSWCRFTGFIRYYCTRRYGCCDTCLVLY